MGQEVEHYCKECGMEFDDVIPSECPLCGEETDADTEETVFVVGAAPNDDEICMSCGGWCEDSDYDFCDYWYDFEHPTWMNFDDLWCEKCIKKRFAQDNPEYGKSGLEPDTFVIWKLALEGGIDLGPKLRDIDRFQAVRAHRYVGDQWQIIYWLDCGWPEAECENWQQLFDDFHTAEEWRDSGFRATDNEAVWELERWIAWDCGPQVAGTWLAQGIVSAPDPRFKELGQSLEKAIRFEQAGLHPQSDWGPSSAEPWLDVELELSAILALKAEIEERHLEFEAIHGVCRGRTHVDTEMDTWDFWDALKPMFSRLQNSGLQLTVENLLMFWGLSTKEILKAIDSPHGTMLVAEMLRREIPASRASVFQRLFEMGVSESTARVLTRKGMTLKQLGEVVKHDDASARLTSLANMLKEDAGLDISVALPWCREGSFTFVISDWIALGMSPTQASKWEEHYFSPREAQSWIAAGVKNPDVAKRRQDAGIRPA